MVLAVVALVSCNRANVSFIQMVWTNPLLYMRTSFLYLIKYIPIKEVLWVKVWYILCARTYHFLWWAILRYFINFTFPEKESYHSNRRIKGYIMKQNSETKAIQNALFCWRYFWVTVHLHSLLFSQRKWTYPAQWSLVLPWSAYCCYLGGCAAECHSGGWCLLQGPEYWLRPRQVYG